MKIFSLSILAFFLFFNTINANAQGINRNEAYKICAKSIIDASKFQGTEVPSEYHYEDKNNIHQLGWGFAPPLNYVLIPNQFGAKTKQDTLCFVDKSTKKIIFLSIGGKILINDR